MTEDQPQLTLTLAIAPPEDPAPLAEIINLRHHQGDADGVAWIVEQFNGWNPPDIPWDHLGVVQALSGMRAGPTRFDLVPQALGDMSSAAPRAMDRFWIEVIEHTFPNLRPFRLNHDAEIPTLILGETTLLGVPLESIMLLIYRRSARRMYDEWRRGERMKEVAEHVISRARQHAHMRTIDAELYELRHHDGRRVFAQKTQAREFRRRTLNPR